MSQDVMKTLHTWHDMIMEHNFVVMIVMMGTGLPIILIDHYLTKLPLIVVGIGISLLLWSIVVWTCGEMWKIEHGG